MRRLGSLLAGVLLVAGPGFSDSLLENLRQELERNFRVLKEKADPAPYFLSYAVTDEEAAALTASFGALTSDNQGRSRTLDVSIRVGSPKLDNYHRVRGDRAHFTQGSPIVLDDNPRAIRRRLWLDTDRAYRLAAERLIKIRTNSQVKVAEADNSDDFSAEKPLTASEPAPAFLFDQEQWARRVRRLSGEFNRHPAVLVGSITVMGRKETKYFVSSEGTQLLHGRGFARVMIVASGRADDGMELLTTESFEAVSQDGLPKDEILAAAIAKAAKELTALRSAPVVEPFVGPAILSGRAAGVFFHEIFGHRVEGHRQKDETEGQTFTKSVGGKVLPEFLSVVFDPTRKKTGGVDLNGWYQYDDEGAAARPVTVVEQGILKTFLMSRSPIAGFPQSNGHGRRQPGLEVVSRQSNLLVESAKKVPDAQLRQLLIGEIKRQNKPYGMYFDQVTGGYTTTQRAGVQAFKVIPLVVYRVYADGRPDELVRGADMVGTPLASFAKILATSDRADVFNGYCGAESGNVPVSAVSPALLVSEIEIEKKQKSQDRPPLLPPPSAAGGGI
ncbi:MAG: peptidase U62 [Acidobacteria bacterium]|nr:peptidase U62 [Acidobacteriota bacterium]